MKYREGILAARPHGGKSGGKVVGCVGAPTDEVKGLVGTWWEGGWPEMAVAGILDVVGPPRFISPGG